MQLFRGLWLFIGELAPRIKLSYINIVTWGLVGVSIRLRDLNLQAIVIALSGFFLISMDNPKLSGRDWELYRQVQGGDNCTQGIEGWTTKHVVWGLVINSQILDTNIF